MLLLPPDAPAWIMLPSMMLGAALSGGLWGFLPGLLKLRFGLNEIISTLMLNYIGIELMRYLVYGPWKAPSSMGFPMTAMFPASAIFPSLFGRTHAGLLLCVVTALALAAFLSRTRLGFELRAAGENPRNARYARIPYGFLLLFVLTLSGALGRTGRMRRSFIHIQPASAESVYGIRLHCHRGGMALPAAYLFHRLFLLLSCRTESGRGESPD